MPAPQPPILPARLAHILEAEFPRYSDAEMARRREAIEQLLSDAGCDHLIFVGANRFGASVNWLTGWPVTTEAVGVLTPDRKDALYIHYYNHLPLARRLADKADVHWAGASAIGNAVAELGRRTAKPDRVAVIGPLGWEQHETLSKAFGKITSLNRQFIALRRIKSA